MFLQAGQGVGGPPIFTPVLRGIHCILSQEGLPWQYSIPRSTVHGGRAQLRRKASFNGEIPTYLFRVFQELGQYLVKFQYAARAVGLVPLRDGSVGWRVPRHPSSHLCLFQARRGRAQPRCHIALSI